MKRHNIDFLFCQICLAFLLVFSASAQVNVTTWHNDVGRSGANTNETILTPANVGGIGTFGPVFAAPMDGMVVAQPLYVSGLGIDGGTHDVVFAATEHDSVYAVDAKTGATLWKRSFLGTGMTSVPSSQMSCTDISPEIGITGTPAIDLSTDTLYVVAVTMPGPLQQLHALDIFTGLDKNSSPVAISASVPGNGVGGDGTTVPFNPTTQRQRSGLLLTNGHIVIAWSAYCDYGSYHGWVMSYNANTLAQEAVFNSTPNGTQGGIWMAGGAPTADANGNIYFGTGNGDFGGGTGTDLGDTMLKMPEPVAGSPWTPLDWFTPFNQTSMDGNDVDLGTGAVMLLPDLPSGATHQQLMIETSKSGKMFEVDRNAMGHYCSSCMNSTGDTNIVEELQIQPKIGLTGSPAYWNGTIYFGGSVSNLKAYSYDTTTGAISTAPVETGAYTFGWLGPAPAISSDGNEDGIVWAIDGSSSNGQTLLAYDATNLNNLLYQYSTDLQVHFAAPMIANGMVYMGSRHYLTGFGVLNPPVAPTPTLTPAGATYTSAQSVTIGERAPGATIYYTTNGTTPTTSSAVYTGPVSVASSETLKAIATATGFQTSTVGLSIYRINATQAGTPVFAPAGGTYTSTQSVAIADATASSTIYYTTNGTTPTTSSPVYTGPIGVASSETVEAIATATGYATSAAGAAAYTISAGGSAAETPTFNPAAGTYSSTQSVAISDATPSSTIYYTTDGSTPTTSSQVYAGPISVAGSETVEALGVESGYSNSAVGSAAYTIGASSYPLMDSFSGSGALSANWTNATSNASLGTPLVPLVQSSGKAVPNTAASWGFAVYTGSSLNNDQYARAKFVVHTTAGSATGPCVRATTGAAGYCYAADDGAIVAVDDGGVSKTILTTCPVPGSGNTIQISAVGTTITCTDVTTGAHASVTDTAFTGGQAGIVVDTKNSSVYALTAFQADCIPSCGVGSTSSVAIDAGGPAAGTYAADEDFQWGGAWVTNKTVSTAGVTNPAPLAVYQSERYGVFTYTVPGLTPGGSYTVYLHFAELYWTKVGQRAFNVTIDGTQVLTNFDIIATAGAPEQAVVETFPATANSKGQIIVSFTRGTADQPKVSGIQVQ